MAIYFLEFSETCLFSEMISNSFQVKDTSILRTPERWILKKFGRCQQTWFSAHTSGSIYQAHPVVLWWSAVPSAWRWLHPQPGEQSGHTVWVEEKGWHIQVSTELPPPPRRPLVQIERSLYLGVTRKHTHLKYQSEFPWRLHFSFVGFCSCVLWARDVFFGGGVMIKIPWFKLQNAVFLSLPKQKLRPPWVHFVLRLAASCWQLCHCLDGCHILTCLRYVSGVEQLRCRGHWRTLSALGLPQGWACSATW